MKRSCWSLPNNNLGWSVSKTSEFYSASHRKHENILQSKDEIVDKSQTSVTCYYNSVSKNQNFNRDLPENFPSMKPVITSHGDIRLNFESPSGQLNLRDHGAQPWMKMILLKPEQQSYEQNMYFEQFIKSWETYLWYRSS